MIKWGNRKYISRSWHSVGRPTNLDYWWKEGSHLSGFFFDVKALNKKNSTKKSSVIYNGYLLHWARHSTSIDAMVNKINFSECLWTSKLKMSNMIKKEQTRVWWGDSDVLGDLIWSPQLGKATLGKWSYFRWDPNEQNEKDRQNLWGKRNSVCKTWCEQFGKSTELRRQWQNGALGYLGNERRMWETG